MSSFEHKNSLRTIEAQIVQKPKSNEARPKFTGSCKKKPCIYFKLQHGISAHALDFSSEKKSIFVNQKICTKM